MANVDAEPLLAFARLSPLANDKVGERASATTRFRINRMFQLAIYRRLATRRRTIARAKA